MSDEIEYLFCVGYWQPRPDGLYEKYVTYHIVWGDDHSSSYTVGGIGYGPRYIKD
jgi:hypothetical protein